MGLFCDNVGNQGEQPGLLIKSFDLQCSASKSTESTDGFKKSLSKRSERGGLCTNHVIQL